MRQRQNAPPVSSTWLRRKRLQSYPLGFRNLLSDGDQVFASDVLFRMFSFFLNLYFWNGLVSFALIQRRSRGPFLEDSNCHRRHYLVVDGVLSYVTRPIAVGSLNGIFSRERGSGSFLCGPILRSRYWRFRSSSWNRQSLWRDI